MVPVGQTGSGKSSVCVFLLIFFASSKSTSHDFKAPSVFLLDASNEKFLLFLAVKLMHATCPTHSVYSLVSNVRRLENIGRCNKTTLA